MIREKTPAGPVGAAGDQKGRAFFMDVRKAEQFILEEARPIERAEFLCRCRGGSKEAVVEALRAFQNGDGGFGHALEADNWNPGSTPITTNTALGILFHTGALDAAEDMAEGMVRYLKSAVDPASGRWAFAVESNRDHPHAVWWEKKGDGISGWNPSVSLAAFLLCRGREDFREMVRQAFAELAQSEGGDSLNCYVLAYGLLKKYGVEAVDMEAARQAISESIKKTVCRDTDKYGVEYVPAPSNFEGGFLTEELRPLIDAELQALDRLQMEDGGFDITWQWWTPYEEEFRQARAFWRPRVTLEKLLFYRRWAR